LLEIWIEKTTMDDILVPLCRSLRINLVPAAGMQSWTSAIRLLERCRRWKKNAYVFYVSDHDPAGDVMPVHVARIIEFFRQYYAPDIEIKLVPIALTAEQVRKFHLPRMPIKPTDQRKSKFELLYGEGAVELDALEALHPGELERLVRQAVEPYIDHDLNRRLYEAKAEAEETARKLWAEQLKPVEEELARIEAAHRRIAQKYMKQLASLDAEYQKELKPHNRRLALLSRKLVELYENFNPDLPRRPAPELDSPDESEWLFDSNRSYLEQLSYYQRRKGNGNGKN
jgi:hypothetical protein